MQITITEKEKDELESLYHEAEGRMLTKMDFSVVDWLDDAESTRFKILYKKDNGFCYDGLCGDKECESCK